MKAAQLPNVVYKPRQFDLSGLKGISDKTLEMHFKLYEGYVKETNRLSEHIADVSPGRQGRPGGDAGLLRANVGACGFEYNGMVLHELYFENMKPRRRPASRRRALPFREGGRGELRVLGGVEDRFRQHRQDARRGLGNLLSGPATRGGSPTTGSLCTRSATSPASSPCW